MTFAEMPYRRPDLGAVLDRYDELTLKFSSAVSAAEQAELIERHEKLSADFQTLSTIAYIRNSINTADPFYEKEMAFFDESAPVFEERVQRFYRAVTASRFREELEKKTGSLFFKNLEIALRSFSPAVVELKKKENALVTEYEKPLASARSDFDGKVLNLSELQKYQISPDRATRRGAWE